MQEAVISAPVHVQAEQYLPTATFRHADESMQIPFAGWYLPLVEVETEMACDVIVLILLAIFRRTGYAVAVVCESKGRCDQWMMREFKVMLVQFASGPILNLQFVLLFNQQQHSAAVWQCWKPQE